MTDRVYPSKDAAIIGRRAAAAAELAGGSSEGWVVPAADDPRNLAADEPDIDETALNAFAESHSASSFDVTIDPGAALVGGSWLARDLASTVTLASSTANQTVYAGWDVSMSHTVIIGLSGAFNADDPRLPLWEFDTDGSGVTAATDVRNLDAYRVANEVVEALTSLGDSAFGGFPLPNADVSALGNFAASDTFSAYPLTHGTDVDAPASAHHSRPTTSQSNSYGSDTSRAQADMLIIDSANVTNPGNLIDGDSATTASFDADGAYVDMEIDVGYIYTDDLTGPVRRMATETTFENYGSFGDAGIEIVDPRDGSVHATVTSVGTTVLSWTRPLPTVRIRGFQDGGSFDGFTLGSAWLSTESTFTDAAHAI